MTAVSFLGARTNGAQTSFRVWAPRAKTVDVVFASNPTARDSFPLVRTTSGHFEGTLDSDLEGACYRFRVDGQKLYPDPASCFQPEGVHGPSQIINLRRFEWTDQAFAGPEPSDLVLYELHLGTFSAAGNFAGATRQLPWLRDLGVTAVEIMPIGDFPGERNWGYDGVSIFAPARCYGTPQDLQLFVDTAHRLGLAVILDVVYNHLGPDGNYTAAFSPYYFSSNHKTPWGDGPNFDGAESAPVREFFIQNALHWLRDYHFDGLRLDATDTLADDSPRHFLAELSDRVRREVADRKLVLIAEDQRNLAQITRPQSVGGFGLDAVWSDDFHHEMRRLLTGDCDSYFQDYRGTVEDLARILNQGWLYTGQFSAHQGKARGTDPSGLPAHAFVFCIQNHDQVGNRPLGDRLHHVVDLATYRAASAALLLAPQTPLLFMGQEWAASSPFQYFTDHHAELGQLVSEGRAREFADFHAKSTQSIPDPQSIETFLRSKLNWDEVERSPHKKIRALYHELLKLRANHPALRTEFRTNFRASALDGDTLRMETTAGLHRRVAVIRLRGRGRVFCNWHENRNCRVLLHTEEERFADDPMPPEVHIADGVTIVFARPGAVVLSDR